MFLGEIYIFLFDDIVTTFTLSPFVLNLNLIILNYYLNHNLIILRLILPMAENFVLHILHIF